MHHNRTTIATAIAGLLLAFSTPAHAQTPTLHLSFADTSQTTIYTHAPTTFLTARLSGSRRASSMVVTIMEDQPGSNTTLPIDIIAFKPNLADGKTKLPVRFTGPFARLFPTDLALTIQARAVVGQTRITSNALRVAYWVNPTSIVKADWALQDDLETATIAVKLRNFADLARSGPNPVAVRDPITKRNVPISLTLAKDGSGATIRVKLVDFSPSATYLQITAKGVDRAGAAFASERGVAVARSTIKRSAFPEATGDALEVLVGSMPVRLTRGQDAYKGETMQVSTLLDGKPVPLGAPFSLPTKEFGGCSVAFNSFSNISSLLVGSGRNLTLTTCDRAGTIYTLRLVDSDWQVIATARSQQFTFDPSLYLLTPEVMAGGGQLWQLSGGAWQGLNAPTPNRSNFTASGDGLLEGFTGSLYRATGLPDRPLLAAIVNDGQAQVFDLEGSAWTPLGPPLKLDANLKETLLDVMLDPAGGSYLVTRKRFAGATPVFAYHLEGNVWKALPDGLSATGAYLQTVFDDRGSPLVAVQEGSVIAVSSPVGGHWARRATINWELSTDSFGVNAGSFTVLPGGRLGYVVQTRNSLAEPSGFVSFTTLLSR